MPFVINEPVCAVCGLPVNEHPPDEGACSIEDGCGVNVPVDNEDDDTLGLPEPACVENARADPIYPSDTLPLPATIETILAQKADEKVYAAQQRDMLLHDDGVPAYWARLHPPPDDDLLLPPVMAFSFNSNSWEDRSQQ